MVIVCFTLNILGYQPRDLIKIYIKEIVTIDHFRYIKSAYIKTKNLIVVRKLGVLLSHIVVLREINDSHC